MSAGKARKKMPKQMNTLDKVQPIPEKPVVSKPIYTTIPRDAVLQSGSPSVKILGKPIPKLVLSSLAYKKQQALVQACDIEIGWLGYVDVEKDGTLYVSDIFVPKQEVSGTTTDIDEEWLGQYGIRLAETEQGCEQLTKMFYWGHSHVDMGTSPSGTDDKTMGQLGANCPVFIRGIFNKRGAANIAIADYSTGLLYLDQPVSVRSDPSINAWAESAIKTFCTEKTYVTKYAYTGHTMTGYVPSWWEKGAEYEDYHGYMGMEKNSVKETPKAPAVYENPYVYNDLADATKMAFETVSTNVDMADLVTLIGMNSSFVLTEEEISEFVLDEWDDLVETAEKHYHVRLVMTYEKA